VTRAGGGADAASSGWGWQRDEAVGATATLADGYQGGMASTEVRASAVIMAIRPSVRGDLERNSVADR